MIVLHLYWLYFHSQQASELQNLFFFKSTMIKAHLITINQNWFSCQFQVQSLATVIILNPSGKTTFAQSGHSSFSVFLSQKLQSAHMLFNAT